MNKITAYFKDAIAEIKKVTWPTKKETYSYTIMVIVISLLTALFLGGLDYLFNWGLTFLINR